MAFNPAIPQPTDKHSTSQNDILQNFTTLNTAWEINHEGFDLVNQGKHNFVSLPEQVAAPATAVNEGAVYSKQSALTTATELFFRRENSGAQIEFTGVLGATPGWTILPSGIILKWGSATCTGADTVTFPVAGTIPVITTVLAVMLTPLNAGAGDIDATVRLRAHAAGTGFDVYASTRTATGAAACTFEYLAIGI